MEWCLIQKKAVLILKEFSLTMFIWTQTSKRNGKDWPPFLVFTPLEAWIKKTLATKVLGLQLHRFSTMSISSWCLPRDGDQKEISIKTKVRMLGRSLTNLVQIRRTNFTKGSKIYCIWTQICASYTITTSTPWLLNQCSSVLIRVKRMLWISHTQNIFGAELCQGNLELVAICWMQRTVIAVLGSQRKTWWKMRTNTLEVNSNGNTTMTWTTVVWKSPLVRSSAREW